MHVHVCAFPLASRTGQTCGNSPGAAHSAPKTGQSSLAKGREKRILLLTACRVVCVTGIVLRVPTMSSFRSIFHGNCSESSDGCQAIVVSFQTP